jgi:hypothetical protein
MPARVFHQKRSVAAAEFDFERLRCREKFRQIEAFKDGLQFDEQIGLSFPFGNRRSKN